MFPLPVFVVTPVFTNVTDAVEAFLGSGRIGVARAELLAPEIFPSLVSVQAGTEIW
jgi:hypothetical protein